MTLIVFWPAEKMLLALIAHYWLQAFLIASCFYETDLTKYS